MKIKPIRIKPLRVVPVEATTLTRGRKRDITDITTHPVSMDVQIERGRTADANEIHDSSGLPPCSYEQKERYEENWEHILNPRMEKHLHTTKDVLHGGRSLNIQFNARPGDDLYRESLDWDIYSKKPKKHAQKLEREIDRAMECDICDVVHVPIPATSGRQYDDMSADLYRIQTPSTRKDAEVDIMERPKKLDTTRHRGIYHETLESQYEKARRGLLQPMRSFKSGLDKQRIREYWRRTGKLR